MKRDIIPFGVRVGFPRCGGTFFEENLNMQRVSYPEVEKKEMSRWLTVT